MADLAEAWNQALPDIREAVTGVGVWSALNAARPVIVEDGVLVIGLKPGESELAGHLKLPNVKRLIERHLGERLGTPVIARVIEGTTAKDWEIAKRRDAEARRLQKIALDKTRRELAAKSNWESVYDQLSRRFAAVPNKSLPQSKARFLAEALELVTEARVNQEAHDEPAERNFARCIERVAQYTEVPSAIIASEVLKRSGEL